MYAVNWVNKHIERLAKTIAPPSTNPSNLFISALLTSNTELALSLLDPYNDQPTILDENGVPIHPTFDPHHSIINPQRRTYAIHAVAEYANIDLLHVLIGTHGVSSGVFDIEGRTPLHYAAASSHPTNSLRCVKYLVIECNVSVVMRDENGHTAYDVAKLNDIRQYLLPLQLQNETQHALDLGMGLPEGTDVGSFRSPIAPPPVTPKILSSEGSDLGDLSSGYGLGVSPDDSPLSSRTMQPPPVARGKYVLALPTYGVQEIGTISIAPSVEMSKGDMEDNMMQCLGNNNERSVSTAYLTNANIGATPRGVINDRAHPSITGCNHSQVGIFDGDIPPMASEVDKPNSEISDQHQNVCVSSESIIEGPETPIAITALEYFHSVTTTQQSLVARKEDGACPSNTNNDPFSSSKITKNECVSPDVKKCGTPLLLESTNTFNQITSKSLRPPPMMVPPTTVMSHTMSCPSFRNRICMATNNKTIDSSKYKPDGFHSSSSDTCLQEKYGHDTSITGPPSGYNRKYDNMPPPPLCSMGVGSGGNITPSSEKSYIFTRMCNDSQSHLLLDMAPPPFIPEPQ